LLVVIYASCDNASDFPILGEYPVSGVHRYEDHSEALLQWAKDGVKDSIVINIDTHDDIRAIPPDRIKRLKQIYEKKDWNALRMADSLADDSLYNVGNFLYAAAKLGIIREVYWVIPFAHYSYPDTANRLRLFMKTYGFSDEDIATFRMDNHCFSGTTGGVPLHVCGIESLPKIAEPVILSIDLDFLPAAAFEYHRDKTSALQMFFDALFAKKYRIRDALVAYSVNGGYMRVISRWLGDEAAKVIESPSYRGSPFWSALQKADIAYKQKRLGKSMNEIMPMLGRFADHPAVQVYIAYADLELGRYDEAFRYAEKACLTHRNYCYALLDLWYELKDSENPAETEKFYERGLELNPDMNNRLVEIALYLRKQKRYDESLKYLLRHRKLNGVYPVDFLIGETLLMKGDEEGAKKYFDSVRVFLRTDRYASVRNVEDVSAIKAAYNFYIGKGMKENALELRNNPRLNTVFNEK